MSTTSIDNHESENFPKLSQILFILSVYVYEFIRIWVLRINFSCAKRDKINFLSSFVHASCSLITSNSVTLDLLIDFDLSKDTNDD